MFYKLFIYIKASFPIWEDDAGKAGKLLFARKEVFPLSPRPSHPFKKSEKTFYLLLPTFVGNRAYIKYTCLEKISIQYSVCCLNHLFHREGVLR